MLIFKTGQDGTLENPVTVCFKVAHSNIGQSMYPVLSKIIEHLLRINVVRSKLDKNRFFLLMGMSLKDACSIIGQSMNRRFLIY